MNDNSPIKLKNQETGNVTIRLGSKGKYTWTIAMPIQDGDSASEVVGLVAIIDAQLKATFPNYATGSTVKYKPFT